MKKVTYLLCLASHLVSAQTPLLDSLRQEINSKKIVDTTYINIRTDYIWQSILAAKADSSLLDYSHETLKQAKKIDYPKGQVLALQRIGVIYQYFLAEPLIALDNYQEAILIIDQNPSLMKYMVSSLNNIGTIYTERREFEEALKIYKRVLKEFDGPSIPEQYLGNVYSELNKLDSSIYYFRRTIERARQEANIPIEANAWSNLALMYTRADTLDKAISSIEKAIALIDQYQIDIVRPTAYINASEVYLKSGNYERAESYVLEALKLPILSSNLFVQKSIYATLL